ncbi:hypothetical protein DKG79_20235 [Escherichia fergusonii]|nr:hypothetical protein DKG79_20235 [Escherichia fergusonii]
MAGELSAIFSTISKFAIFEIVLVISVILARKFVIAVVKLSLTGEDLASHVYPCYTSHSKETIMTNNPLQHVFSPASMVFLLS